MNLWAGIPSQMRSQVTITIHPSSSDNHPGNGRKMTSILLWTVSQGFLGLLQWAKQMAVLRRITPAIELQKEDTLGMFCYAVWQGGHCGVDECEWEENKK